MPAPRNGSALSPAIAPAALSSSLASLALAEPKLAESLPPTDARRSTRKISCRGRDGGGDGGGGGGGGGDGGDGSGP